MKTKVLLFLIFTLLLKLTGCTTLKAERLIENSKFNRNSKEHTVRISKDEKKGKLKLHPFVSISEKENLEVNLGNHPKVNNEGVFEVYSSGNND